MVRLLKVAAALLCAAGISSQASTSAITATVTDTDGTPWANATYSAIIHVPGQPNVKVTIGGVPVTSPCTQASPCSASSSGVITGTYTDTSSVDQPNARWVFTIKPNASVDPVNVSVAIIGATPNLTANFSSVKAPRFPASPSAYGYADVEVVNPALGNTYFNTATVCSSTGGIRQYGNSGWVCGGSGGGGGGATFAPAGIQFATSTTAANIATPAQMASALRPSGTTYLACEGDSRMADSAHSGTNTGADQDICHQLAKQSNFLNIAGVTDLAVGGSTCASMTARYASGTRNYRPGGSAVPAGVTTTLLPLEISINDIRVGVSALTEEACVYSYIKNAIADGFTVIPMTSYWYGALTDAQAVQWTIFNDWIRNIPLSGMFTNAQIPFVFDFDLYFPPDSASPYFYPASASFNITAASVASGTMSLTTATQSLTANTQLFMSGFPASSPSACLNNQTVIVSATGLSSTTVQAPVGCPDFTDTSAGVGQNKGLVSTGGSLHMGPEGNALAAQAFNQAFGLASTGSSSVIQPNFRDYWQPPSGIFRINGCIAAGPTPFTNCTINGGIYAATPSSPTTGIVWIGNGFVRNTGAGGWSISNPNGGGMAITGGTSRLSYLGGDIVAAVTSTASFAGNGNTGNLVSCTTTDCTQGILRLGTNMTLQQTGTTATWTASGQVNLNQEFSAAGYNTATNCTSTASPAVCSSAAAGTNQVAAAATTLTVNTTAVTAISEIHYSYTTAASGCTSAPANIASLIPPYTSAIVAGTSFTMTLPVAPTTNPACVQWHIVN